jgi:hypothetical protein
MVASPFLFKPAWREDGENFNEMGHRQHLAETTDVSG